MTVENSNAQQTQQAEPQNSGQGQAQEAQQMSAAPTIEEVMESLRGPDALDPQRAAEEESHQKKLDSIDYQPKGELGKDPSEESSFDPQKFEAIKREEAKLWEQKQQIKKEREEIERMRMEAQEERGSFESHLDELLSDPSERKEQEEVDSEYEYIDPEEFEQRILEKLNKRKEEESLLNETNEQINQYKESVSKFAEENIDKFPLMASLNKVDMVWDSLNQTYDHFASKYGEEKAAELVDSLSMEQVVGHVEKKLASEMESLLQYDSVRSYLSQQLGKMPPEDKSQDQSYRAHQSKGQSQTLTNNSMIQDSGDFQSIDDLTGDAALIAATKFIQRG